MSKVKRILKRYKTLIKFFPSMEKVLKVTGTISYITSAIEIRPVCLFTCAFAQIRQNCSED
jgi:hypothetical protein